MYLNKKVFSSKLWLQRVLSVEVSHTSLKKCSTRLDCSYPTESTESRLCVGLTKSRTQHRRVTEKESDSWHFVRRDAFESTQSPSLETGLKPLMHKTPALLRMNQVRSEKHSKESKDRDQYADGKKGRLTNKNLSQKLRQGLLA